MHAPLLQDRAEALTIAIQILRVAASRAENRWSPFGVSDERVTRDTSFRAICKASTYELPASGFRHHLTSG